MGPVELVMRKVGLPKKDEAPVHSLSLAHGLLRYILDKCRRSPFFDFGETVVEGGEQALLGVLCGVRGGGSGMGSDGEKNDSGPAVRKFKRGLSGCGDGLL